MRDYERFTQEEISVLRPVMRQAFSGEQGLQTLAIILKALGFWDRSESEEDVALRNFAVWLMEVLGVAQDHNYEHVMRLWMDLPSEPPQEVRNG